MTVINEAEFVAGNSGLPPCSNNEIISRVLGVEPVAHLSLTHIDVQIAYWRWPGGTVARFKLHQPLLAIHIAGEAQMSHRSTEKRRSYRSSCGTSTLLPSGTLVDWQFRSGGVDHLTVSLGDSAPVLCEFVAAIEAFEVVPPDPLIRELTRAIVDKLTARRRPTQDLERALGLLTETLLSRYIDRTRLHLGCKPAVSQRSSSPMEIERLIEDLPLRCGENLTVTELARESGMCVTQFNERFKALTGVTPHQFLVRVRLTRVCDALFTSNDTIASIAMACGFSSQSHLTTVFHKALGVTPQQYRGRGGAQKMPQCDISTPTDCDGF